MPRRRRHCPVGLPVHIVQRGNNKQVCFTSNDDMAAYANWLKEAAKRYGMAVHAWVFMTNHIHLLVTPVNDNAISNCMQYLGRYYVRYFNFQYDRTGTLFEGRFNSNLVQSDHYLHACYKYIELNPVRAGLVQDPADYVWSSYRANAFGRLVQMWSPHKEYLALGNTRRERLRAYQQLFLSEMGSELITNIRNALNTGLVLGNDRFRAEVEQLTGQPQKHLKRGPKKVSA
jgi:putative transposase